MSRGKLLMFLKGHSQPVEVLTKTCTNMVYFVAVQGGIILYACSTRQQNSYYIMRNNIVQCKKIVKWTFNLHTICKRRGFPGVSWLSYERFSLMDD